jgi:hypothetical protein
MSQAFHGTPRQNVEGLKLCVLGALFLLTLLHAVVARITLLVGEENLWEAARSTGRCYSCSIRDNGLLTDGHDM